MRSLKNISHLGVKELVSLSRDPMLLLFIMLAFTVFVYTAASATPQTLYKTPILLYSPTDCDNFYNLDVNKTIQFIKTETVFKRNFTFNKKTGKSTKINENQRKSTIVNEKK